MYYDEKIINGVLHWRGTPNGEWIAKTPEQLTERLMEVAKQLEALQAVPKDKPQQVFHPLLQPYIVPYYAPPQLYIKPWEVTCTTGTQSN